MTVHEVPRCHAQVRAAKRLTRGRNSSAHHDLVTMRRRQHDEEQKKQKMPVVDEETPGSRRGIMAMAPALPQNADDLSAHVIIYTFSQHERPDRALCLSYASFTLCAALIRRWRCSGSSMCDTAGTSMLLSPRPDGGGDELGKLQQARAFACDASIIVRMVVQFSLLTFSVRLIALHVVMPAAFLPLSLSADPAAPHTRLGHHATPPGL